MIKFSSTWFMGRNRHLPDRQVLNPNSSWRKESTNKIRIDVNYGQRLVIDTH